MKTHSQPKSRILPVSLLTVALPGALSEPAVAQRALVELNPPPGITAFGGAVAPIGDRDGDLVDEIAVVDSVFVAGQTEYWLRVYSGAGGALLVERPLPFGRRGPIRAVGDVDGDGDVDLAMLDSSRVIAFDAVSAVPVLSVQATIGVLDDWGRSEDFDGDGVDDFVVGSSFNGSSDRIAILSGVNGAQLAQLAVFEGGSTYVGALGRANGTPLVVTAGFAGIRLIGDALSTPTILASFDSEPSSWINSAGPVSDVNGDGVDDLLVTALGTAPLGSGLGGTYVLSGVDLQVLWGVDAPPVQQRNLIPLIHVAAAGRAVGDQNGDGIADVCARVRRAAPIPSDPAPSFDDLVVFSGTDGARIRVLENRRAASLGLAGAVAIPDRDGDGIPELAAALGPEWTRPAQVRVFGSDAGSDGPVGMPFCEPRHVNSTGIGTEMTVSRMGAGANATLELAAASAPPGVFGIFVASNEFVSAPIAAAPGLCLTGPIGRIAQPGQVVQVGAGGDAGLTIDASPLPLATGFVPVLPGDTWAFQFWHRDASTSTLPNFRFSGGVYVRF